MLVGRTHSRSVAIDGNPSGRSSDVKRGSERVWDTVSRRSHLRRTGWLIAGFVIWGNTAQAATYYVAKTGKDANSCAQAQSSSAPKLTIGAAVGCLTAGDTLYVRAGSYNETLIYTVPSGSSWSSKVRIAAYPGETVWMRPAAASVTSVLWFGRSQHYIEFDGINLDASKLMDSDIVRMEAGDGKNDAHHIRIQNAELIGGKASPGGKTQWIVTGGSPDAGHELINLTIHDVGSSDFDHGIYIGESNVLVEGCNIYNISGAGIHLYNGWGSTFSNVVVRNNAIHDSLKTRPGQRHWGIIVANGSRGNQIYNNVIYNILADGGFGAGIHVYAGDGNGIFNNTVYAGTEGIFVGNDATSTVIRNNVAYANVTNYTNMGSGTTSSNNSVSGIDPKFMNPSAHDFRLSGGSPLIDAGTSGVPVTTDFSGTPRPQGGAYDVGALEWSSSSAGNAAPPTPVGLRIVQ
jgi:Right handed beta helix region